MAVPADDATDCRLWFVRPLYNYAWEQVSKKEEERESGERMEKGKRNGQERQKEKDTERERQWVGESVSQSSQSVTVSDWNIRSSEYRSFSAKSIDREEE